jgi:protein-glutamine gamma-glutamyltransferase
MTEAAATRVRLAAFAALAAFTAANWVNLVEHPPLARTGLAVLCAIAGATALALIADRAPSRWLSVPLAALAVLAALAGAALALGLPAAMLAPSRWGELGSNVGDGLGSLGGADYPYAGGETWSRLDLLLALAPLLVLGAALAFWPRARSSRWALRLALALLLVAYGVAATVSPPDHPLALGLILFILIGAWIWLPGLQRRGLVAATAMAAVTALLALPVAARLDGSDPWLDYRNWDWSGSPLGKTESFQWSHTYGPLDWSRDGRWLLQVRSSAPHYWATSVLDDFDGFRWVSTPSGPAVDLPLGRRRSGPLRRKWILRASFGVHALSTTLLPGAGTVLAVDGIGEAVRTPEGVSLGQPVSDGDSYSIRAYDPQPSVARMRASEGRYPALLSAYTTVGIPAISVIQPPGQQLHASPKTVTISSVTTPLRGGSDQLGERQAAVDFEHSPYTRVFGLARRLAAGQPTAYDVASAMQRYLRSGYTYSESPPKRVYPLRAFLFRDQVGYCQQFSGAMALMLRMVGIPTRVVGGFAPGRPAGGGYQVTDLDAHSWVQVYFNGIGWVTFDPTPAAAPAIAESSRIATSGPRPTGLQFRTGLHGRGPAPAGGQPRASNGGSSMIWLALAVVALSIAVTALLTRRAWRRRPRTPAQLAEAQALELRGAVALRHAPPPGATLRWLERRLRAIGGAPAAAYAVRLGECRYGDGSAGPPSGAERRRVRRALVAGLGPRGWLRGWLAMPPLWPSRVREPRPRS